MEKDQGIAFSFAERARRRMTEMGLKASDVARETGYSAQYISDLLLGHRRWNETTINSVCQVLGMKVEFVVAEQANTYSNKD